MTIELRPTTQDEYTALARVVQTAFGGGDVAEAEHGRPIFEFDRSLAALDGDQIVASAGAYSFELTLPGSTTAPAAGVTWVGVLPTHRRQGVLRSMMTRQLDDIAERGEAIAVLTASESLIYGRFGYGMATTDHGVRIDPRHSAFLPEVPVVGRVRLVEPDEAGKLLPGIYDTWRLRQPGSVTRRPEWWEQALDDPEFDRRGASARFYAVHETEPGEPDGYVSYRVKSEWDAGFPAGELRRQDLVALTPEAHTALWRFCLDLDLLSSVTANVPADEPLRWQLADPRRFRVTGTPDMLWLRLVDVAAALGLRRYSAQDRLVFDVDDPFRPAGSGRYEVDGGPDGAVGRRSDADADISLGVADLGAAYLGGVRFSTLARAGRVSGSADALLRADQMFASIPAPFCNTGF